MARRKSPADGSQSLSETVRFIARIGQTCGQGADAGFLLDEFWNGLADAQYLRVYVRQPRQKIETDLERPQYVLTVVGVGYRPRAPADRAKEFQTHT